MSVLSQIKEEPLGSTDEDEAIRIEGAEIDAALEDDDSEGDSEGHSRELALIEINIAAGKVKDSNENFHVYQAKTDEVKIANEELPRPAVTCNICGKECSNGRKLTKHKNYVHKEKPWTCKKCQKAFRYQSQLMRHEFSHLPVKDSSKSVAKLPKKTCPICNTNVAGLWQHLLIHSKERSRDHHCQDCGKSFFSSCHLNQHVRGAHRREGKAFPCSQCSAGFTRPNNLKHHVAMKHRVDS